MTQQTPSWDDFQPYIRKVVIAALRERQAEMRTTFAQSDAQIAAMVGGMMGGVAVTGALGEDAESIADGFMSGMAAGGYAASQQVQEALLVAFDAAVAKLEAD